MYADTAWPSSPAGRQVSPQNPCFKTRLFVGVVVRMPNIVVSTAPMRGVGGSGGGVLWAGSWGGGVSLTPGLVRPCWTSSVLALGLYSDSHRAGTDIGTGSIAGMDTSAETGAGSVPATTSGATSANFGRT